MQAFSISNQVPGVFAPGLSIMGLKAQKTETLDSAPLWKLIVQLLPERDAETEWYQVSEIAPLLGLKPRGLLKHARDLWPNWEGQYRLNRGQAESLIRRVCYAGRKLPDRAAVLAEVRARTSETEERPQ